MSRARTIEDMERQASEFEDGASYVRIGTVGSPDYGAPTVWLACKDIGNAATGPRYEYEWKRKLVSRDEAIRVLEMLRGNAD